MDDALTKIMSRRAGLAVMLCFTAAALLVLYQSTRAGGLLRLVLQYSTPVKMSPIVDPFLIDVEERTFRFFWDTANPKNGLIPDRFPTPSYSSVAAVGFGLTSYPVAVERGYITRKQARQRVLATLRFFRNAPQGHSVNGRSE